MATLADVNKNLSGIREWTLVAVNGRPVSYGDFMDAVAPHALPHLGDFKGKYTDWVGSPDNEDKMKLVVADILNRQSNVQYRRTPGNKATAVWCDALKAIAIWNHEQPEQSTAFVPSSGKAYFDNNFGA
jgi:hypothetical protein